MTEEFLSEDDRRQGSGNIRLAKEYFQRLLDKGVSPNAHMSEARFVFLPTDDPWLRKKNMDMAFKIIEEGGVVVLQELPR